MKRLLLALSILSLALPAGAHHMKGIPHFGYKDMGWYPQIPSKETVRNVKGMLVVATTMPGDPKAGTRVNIHVYVKDLKSDRVVSAPIHYSITRRKLFFLSEQVAPSTEVTPIMELYQIVKVFEKPGKYTLALDLPNDARTTVPLEVAR